MSIFSDAESLFNDLADAVGSMIDYVMKNPDAIAFLIVFAIAIASAVFVVASKEVVHSAFYLALTAVCVAVTYFFLEAEFVGVVQLMVYMGAVVVVFAFSIMLTRKKIMTDGKRRDEDE